MDKSCPLALLAMRADKKVTRLLHFLCISCAQLPSFPQDSLSLRILFFILPNLFGLEEARPAAKGFASKAKRVCQGGHGLQFRNIET